MQNHLEQTVVFAISSATMLDLAQLGILAIAKARWDALASAAMVLRLAFIG